MAGVDVPSFHDTWMDEPQDFEAVDTFLYVEIVAHAPSEVTYTTTPIHGSEIPTICANPPNPTSRWTFKLLITSQTYTRNWHRQPYSAPSAHALHTHWHIPPHTPNLSSHTLPFSPIPGDPTWTGLLLRFLYELPLVCTFTSTHHDSSRTTYALCYGLDALSTSRFLARLQRYAHCAYQPLLCPLLLTEMALAALERFSTTLYLDFVPVREGLGCNPYLLPAQGVAVVDVGVLPRRLTAIADAVASNAFCVGATAGAVECLSCELDVVEGRMGGDGGGEGEEGGRRALVVGMRDRVGRMRLVVENTERRNAYLRESVLAQVQMVYALLAQKDNELNHRYGADMRVIAIVTLLFLPGTFVATLFSASFWDFGPGNKGSVVSGWVWLYWVITITLTITVLGAWKWHPLMLRRWRGRRDGDEEVGKKEV